MEVIDVDRRLVERLRIGEYSTAIPPATAVDAVAIFNEQVRTQRTIDGALGIAVNEISCGLPFVTVYVFHEIGQGQYAVEIIRNVRKHSLGVSGDEPVPGTPWVC